MTTSAIFAQAHQERDATEVASAWAHEHGLAHEFAEMLAASAEIFPGEVAVELRHDPEIKGDSHLVFCVAGCEPLEDLARRNDLWHKQLLKTATKDPFRFALSIDVQG